MNFNRNTLAATFISGSTILAGSAGGAFAAEPVQKMIDILDLLIDKVVHRFNGATRTAIREKCALEKNVVSCDVRILNNEALLDHVANVIYVARADGKIDISAQSKGDRKWTPDTFNFLYRPAMNGAVPSMGSSTQTYSASSRTCPSSSP